MDDRHGSYVVEVDRRRWTLLEVSVKIAEVDGSIGNLVNALEGGGLLWNLMEVWKTRGSRWKSIMGVYRSSRKLPPIVVVEACFT